MLLSPRLHGTRCPPSLGLELTSPCSFLSSRSHPEHGPLIASCSYDRTVRIWEENNDGQFPLLPRLVLRSSSLAHPSPLTEPRNSGKRWHSLAKLVEAKGSVRDLAFAPSEFGLRLVRLLSLVASPSARRVLD